MALGAVEFDDDDNNGLRATSLVLAFNPVARQVTDEPGGFFKLSKFHYEDGEQTEIIVSGKVEIGTHGGELTKHIVVPFKYDEVKQLLAEGLKRGETVDFTAANAENLRASLRKKPPAAPSRMNL